jgi:hypothetical protein
MKVLFLTLSRINSIEDRGIYTDLLRKFRDQGHNVTIVNPQERKFKKSTSLKFENGVNILSVWTTNFQKTNIIEKTNLIRQKKCYESITTKIKLIFQIKIAEKTIIIKKPHQGALLF